MMTIRIIPRGINRRPHHAHTTLLGSLYTIISPFSEKYPINQVTNEIMLESSDKPKCWNSEIANMNFLIQVELKFSHIKLFYRNYV